VSSSRWSGKTLGGRYQIEDLLGQGGVSAVYKATDPNLNRAVGVKLIHPHLADDAEFVRRFRKEAAVVAQLRHPNIVQVFDFNRDGDDFYMEMEFVDGETLRERLNRLSAEGGDATSRRHELCYQHLRGGRLRSPAELDSPRHQTGQHHAEFRGPTHPDGLWHRQDHGRPPIYSHWCDGWHRPLYVARADPW
jgi:serine/threonine protein kinase